MADVLERARRRSAPRSDARETLEPLLDELMRSLGFERAAVLLYDEDRAALAGSFGIGVPDTIARELVVPLAPSDDPIAAVLRGGLPELIRDATTDERISPGIRETLAKAKLGPIVAAPLRSTTERRTIGQDGKGSAAPGWEHRGEWAGVVLLSRAAGVTQNDVDALVPFARQAEEALSQQRNVDLLRETGEAHAIEKEWLWWMVNGVGDAVLVTDSNNDIVLRNVPNPIIVVDNDNHIMSMNPAAERLFKPASATSRAAHTALANDARFTSFLAGLRLDPVMSKRGEIGLTDPATDDRLEMEVSATEIKDGRGAVMAIVSVMQDVGRLRELERRRLEQVLFDSEKLAAIGRLAASIAYEVNKHLEAVQNALYLLEKELESDASNRQYLEIASRETQRMSRILRQMLGFYRQQETMGEIDLNALAEEAASLVLKRLRERGVQIAIQLDPRLPRIRASADQLKQVLLNLLLNAADSMPKGGTITVATQTGAGTETEVFGRDAVQIQVRDTGDGIPDELIAQIFEPFFATKPGKGTGLGLWVSQGIVQSHGGTMRVRSRVGRGTTFMITLPVQGPPSDARAA